MPVSEVGDPRLKALFGATDPRDGGVRPTVRLPRKGLPPIAIAAIAVVAGVLLFLVLDSRRTATPVPNVHVPVAADQNAWSPPPPLYIPPVPDTVPVQTPVIQPLVNPPVGAAPKSFVVDRETALPRAMYVPPPTSPLMVQPPRPTLGSSGSALVIDTSTALPSNSAATPPAATVSNSIGAGPLRVRASVFANRSTTVPQGHLIPAVLETGFNSTQPGYARAIVSRDVRSFDGTNVLIPRGSRLIGEYRAATDRTQKRAIINWTRLIRPDGMTIAMDSPAVDTLGRGGVPASVNTHFFRRLTDALLQTTVDLGRAVAGRAITGPVVILPAAAGTAVPQTAPSNSYLPTLSVPAGKSISVFVAHDLDFGPIASKP